MGRDIREMWDVPFQVPRFRFHVRGSEVRGRERAAPAFTHAGSRSKGRTSSNRYIAIGAKKRATILVTAARIREIFCGVSVIESLALAVRTARVVLKAGFEPGFRQFA